jgi:hypothetical protein
VRFNDSLCIGLIVATDTEYQNYMFLVAKSGPLVALAGDDPWLMLVTRHYKELVIYSGYSRCYYHSVEEPYHPGVYVMRSVSPIKEETQAPDRLTETIVYKLNNPALPQISISMKE